jgi:hypothetical protein
MNLPEWFPAEYPFAAALQAVSPSEKIEAYKAFVRQETLRRLALLDACEKDPGLRNALMQHYEIAGVRWVNDWVWVESPFAESIGLGSRVPLYLYPRSCLPAEKRDDELWLSQVEIWEWWDQLEAKSKTQPEGVEGLLKKSREMAMSFAACAKGAYLGCFREGVRTLYISITQKEHVDKLGEMKTLIEKARYILTGLPSWMTGGWDRSNEEHSKLALLTVPKTGSILAGAWGPNAGVSDRCLFAFGDEDAVNPHAANISKGVSKTARVYVRITTSRGPATSFAMEWSKGVKPRAFLHWSGNPFLDSGYADRYELDQGQLARAQELDGDDESSEAGLVIPAPWVDAAMKWKPSTTEWTTRTVGYDPADEGQDKAARFVRVGPILMDGEASATEKPREGYERLCAMAERRKATRVHYDDGGGYAGTLKSTHAQKLEDGSEFGFVLVPVTFGGKIPKNLVFDDSNRAAHERFSNIRTAIWWNLRERCRKTWELVNGLREWPEDECVSLPNDSGLRSDLLLPRIVQRGTKSGITAKADMIRSPDKGDAACLAFADFIRAGEQVSHFGKATKESVAEMLKKRKEAIRKAREKR